jgi:hypothetical protein
VVGEEGISQKYRLLLKHSESVMRICGKRVEIPEGEHAGNVCPTI